MKQLNSNKDPKHISIHTMFGLIAQSFQSRTSICEEPTLTSFHPFQPSKCGNWRSFGSVKNTIQTTNQTIQLESFGDTFTFSIPPQSSKSHHHSKKDSNETSSSSSLTTTTSESPLIANVVKVQKILANNSYESVWDISLELNGQRHTGTVSCYRTGQIGSQNTEIDGKISSLHFTFIIINNNFIYLFCSLDKWSN